MARLLTRAAAAIVAALASISHVEKGKAEASTHPHRLLSYDADLLGHQGWSVDLSGDRAIVGAPFTQGGYALVFDLTTGSLLHKLQGSDSFDSDLFGFSVAIDGELAIVGEG